MRAIVLAYHNIGCAGIEALGSASLSSQNHPLSSQNHPLSHIGAVLSSPGYWSFNVLASARSEQEVMQVLGAIVRDRCRLADTFHLVADHTGKSMVGLLLGHSIMLF